MDDRLRARLQVVADPVEPHAEFVEQLHDTLAARLDFPGAATHGAEAKHLRRSGRPWLLAAAAIALAIALAGGALIAGAVVERLRLQASLLDTIQTNGAMRVAVRSDHPQVLVPGGALAGFDIDVARALGDRLELDTELLVMTVDRMLADDPRGAAVAAVARLECAQPGGGWGDETAEGRADTGRWGAGWQTTRFVGSRHGSTRTGTAIVT